MLNYYLSHGTTTQQKWCWSTNVLVRLSVCILDRFVTLHSLNSLWHSDGTWYQIPWPTLIQCNGLLPGGTKPLPAPLLPYHQWSQRKSPAILQEIIQPSVTKVHSKITSLKFNYNPPRASEFEYIFDWQDIHDISLMFNTSLLLSQL